MIKSGFSDRVEKKHYFLLPESYTLNSCINNKDSKRTRGLELSHEGPWMENHCLLLYICLFTNKYEQIRHSKL